VTRTLTVSGPGGRLLEVEVAGPEDGAALIFHHGTPSVRDLFEPLVREGAARGIRHIGYSRPGYASSTRAPGRSVADCAHDVEAIADELGVERFFVAGLSGGGPHALACAALLGERVIAAATIGGVAPWHAEGLDFLHGMGEDNHIELGAAASSEAELEQYLNSQLPAFAHVSGAEIAQAYGQLVSRVDREAMTGEFTEFLARGARRAMSAGIWGWFDDDLAFVTPWGFDLAAIKVPLTVWQGEQDRFVPPSHARWLSEHVPGAELELRPEHGHLSLLAGGYGEILERLRR
jgi:pimeloyl-ACP methyl ester carboxylesterase